MGHTSTSVSLACGLAMARDLADQDFRVVAVIGDGALSGGLAFEGLDAAGGLNPVPPAAPRPTTRSVRWGLITATLSRATTW